MSTPISKFEKQRLAHVRKAERALASVSAKVDAKIKHMGHPSPVIHQCCFKEINL